MKKAIRYLINRLSLNRIRFVEAYSWRWFWTPWTHRFGAGGWVFLSFSWLRDKWSSDNTSIPTYRRMPVEKTT